ncbi:MAG: alkaline ceramidase [Ruminiclostridium sp.]|nr:alkaline ceramidase [Ruminiclostridium sp.]
MIKLGYAQTDITPNTPQQLVGFNRANNTSKGILKPLLAQVSIWESENRQCLITIDSIGFKRELADILRNKVSNMLDISCDKVMLCFSHCHSAPNADTSAEYFEMVCENVLTAVQSAKADICPVSVAWDNAEVDIGVNRREDSISSDKRAGVLKVCGSDKEEKKLLLIRVTAHCNVLKSDNYLISPDYFGSIRELLQEKYGCPIMVIQGSAGNIAPKYFNSAETPIDARGSQYIRSITALEDMAFAVYEKLSQRIDLLKVTDTAAVDMYSREINLYADVPSLKEAEKISEEAMKYCGIDGTSWLEEIKKLHNAGVYRQEERIEVQYFAIGNWCICGVPYELMVEFALESTEKLNDPFFYVNGYTNGCLSYFPTKEEYDKGGYEVYWSLLIYFKYFNRVFPFERDSGDKLIEFITKNAPNINEQMEQKSNASASSATGAY